MAHLLCPDGSEGIVKTLKCLLVKPKSLSGHEALPAVAAGPSRTRPPRPTPPIKTSALRHHLPRALSFPGSPPDASAGTPRPSRRRRPRVHRPRPPAPPPPAPLPVATPIPLHPVAAYHSVTPTYRATTLEYRPTTPKTRLPAAKYPSSTPFPINPLLLDSYPRPLPYHSLTPGTPPAPQPHVPHPHPTTPHPPHPFHPAHP
ncbi:vegetative cell wall protein gp1-like, partial [Penaeus japonicus]|uniref:vegetative cell wall protein gp1-like n=1 Tax=Penaeus japonicus TaxID=27405 RepID=UPI001C70D1D1